MVCFFDFHSHFKLVSLLTRLLFLLQLLLDIATCFSDTLVTLQDSMALITNLVTNRPKPSHKHDIE